MYLRNPSVKGVPPPPRLRTASENNSAKITIFHLKSTVFGPFFNGFWVYVLGGTPSPLYGICFPTKILYGLGGYPPPPPFTDGFRKKVFGTFPNIQLNNGATSHCDYNTTTLINKPCDTLIEKNTFECIYILGDLYKKLSGWARLSPTATPSTGIGCIIIKAALSFVHFVINENHDFK